MIIILDCLLFSTHMDAFIDYILPPLVSSWSNFDQSQDLSSGGDGETVSQTTSAMFHECIHRNTSQNLFDHSENMIFQESNLVRMNNVQNTSFFGLDDFKCHHNLCCFSDNQLRREFLNCNTNLPTQPRNLIPDLRLSFPVTDQGDDSNPLSTFPPQLLDDSQSTSAAPPQLWSSVYSGVHSLLMDQINSQNSKLFMQHEHEV